MDIIRCPLKEASELYGNSPALIADELTLSFREYDRRVASAAAQLKNAGIREADRVAIVSNNRWEIPVLFFALLRIGAVSCNISPRFPEQSIRLLLEKIGCSKVVDPGGSLKGPWTQGLHKIEIESIVNREESNLDIPLPVAVLALDAHSNILFTSGTSAEPKAVLHSVSNHYFNALGANQNIVVKPGDRWLLSLPLFHAGGLSILFRTILDGAAVVIPREKESISESVEKRGVTHLSLVSTQLFRLLNDPKTPSIAKALKAVLVGGSAVPASLITKALDCGLPLFTTYGQTEMASQVTTTRANDSLERLVTSGKVLEHRKIKVDEDGEILVKGETLFKGYVEGNTITSPVDEGGWFRTGDIGLFDADAYLRVLGRKDNMFISGGENIQPEEIERVLCLLEGISDAVVVPLADEEFGFRPVAFIRTPKGEQVDTSQVVSHLEQYLPRFKIPVSFYEWPGESVKQGLKPDRRYFEKLAGFHP